MEKASNPEEAGIMDLQEKRRIYGYFMEISFASP